MSKQRAEAAAKLRGAHNFDNTGTWRGTLAGASDGA